MSNGMWFVVILAVLGIAALLGAALLWRRAGTADPDGPQRDRQEEFTAPDFTEQAGFAVTRYPSADLLIPGRVWLVNGRTAEIEYNILPAGAARLRAAHAGQLDLPDTYLSYEYESVSTLIVDGTEVKLSQSPGRSAMAQWTKRGFDYALLCEEPQMNLLGGVISDFVTQTEAAAAQGVSNSAT